MAQREAASQICRFNNKSEYCNLRDILDRNGKYTGTLVKWLSDGKTVRYIYYDCSGNDATTRCRVKIIEDNGRTTHGKSETGGRGTFITSSKGNTTLIPPY